MLKIDNKLITKIHTDQQGKSGQNVWTDICKQMASGNERVGTQCLY